MVGSGRSSNTCVLGQIFTAKLIRLQESISKGSRMIWQKLTLTRSICCVENIKVSIFLLPPGGADHRSITTLVHQVQVPERVCSNMRRYTGLTPENYLQVGMWCVRVRNVANLASEVILDAYV